MFYIKIFNPKLLLILMFISEPSCPMDGQLNKVLLWTCQGFDYTCKIKLANISFAKNCGGLLHCKSFLHS